MKKDYIDYCSDPFRGLAIKLRKKAILLLFMLFGILSVQGQNVTVSGALSGNGSYATLGEAFTGIGTSQTGANISVVITGDTSEGAIAVLGAGDWASLTITPVGVRTITGSTTSELIHFNGADNVTINGLNTGGNALTISNTNTSAATNASTIRFMADATNNTITNCTILGSNTTNTGTDGGVVFFGNGTTTGNDGNTISHCDIGPAGANLPVKLIYSKGLNTNEGTCNSEITIDSCNLYDFFIATNGSAAIYVQPGNTAWNITNNKIYQTATRTFTAGYNMYGIYFSSATYGNNVRITNNVIGYANSGGTGTLTITGNTPCGFWGIYNVTAPNATLPCEISNNTIGSISMNSTAGVFYGINNSTSVGANTVNIKANTIRSITITNTTGDVYGISAGGAGTMVCNDNVIDNITRNMGGHFYGITYGISNAVTFDSNTISNLSLTGTTGSTKNFYGIYSSVATPTETFTKNTLSNFSSALTVAQTVVGIANGSSAAGNKTFQNNTISNFSIYATGTGTIIGIRMNTGGPLNEFSGNTIHTFAGGGTVNGIAVAGGTANTIFKNKIYGLSTTALSAAVYGMAFTGGTNNVYNNLVGSLTAPAANGPAGYNQVVGINATVSTTALNLYNNTVFLNASSSGANFGSTAVSVGGNPSLTMRNNILVNNSTANGTGFSVVFRRLSLTGYEVASNNNLFYGPVIFYDGTNIDTTVDAFKIRLGNRDGQSVNENPNFLSTTGSDLNYLHINPAIPTQIESGGTAAVSLTEDFDADVRNATTPDIGADEFAGTPLTVVAINSLGITPSGPQCTAVSRTVTANVTAGGNDITSVVLKYYVNGVAQTPIAMTGGTLTAGTTSVFTATIPTVVPVNANITWEVIAADPVTTRFLTGTGYKDVPLLGLTSMVTATVNSICGTGSSMLSAALAPQATPFATSFESGITEFTGSAVAGAVILNQTTAYASNGTASMLLKTVSNSADVNASTAANIDLSTVPQAYLTFSHIAGLESATTPTDYGYVQYSSDGGATWVNFPISSYMGTGALYNGAVCFSAKSYSNWAFTAAGSVPSNSMWQNETIAIPTVALTSQFKIRFRYTTSPSNNYYGWLIDNVKIVTGLPGTVTAYSWSDGTTEVGTGSTLSVSPTATTTYTAKITSAGCTVTSAPMTITVAPITTPTFAQVAPICSGATLSALPVTSIEGITGTWSPALNNTATTTYTFTPNAGQCGTTTTMTIMVNPNVIPTFTQVAAICSGATLSPLPTTSDNGIAGTWSPALNNTATTTYTFTPDAGPCATTTTMTITVNPIVTSTFAQIAAICSGATLSALPTTSIEGIVGTWSPALDNTATTTYTFTPAAGQCGTTATMTITVNPSATPTFTQVAAICSGATLSALPTTSNNGIVGTWLPALDNTATTTYTFTPDAGPCATTATMTITVNPIVTPTFTQVAAICPGGTLAALPTTSDNGITGTWSPALNNTATTTYTFTPNVGQCGATTTMTITVNSNTTPTFTQVAAICSGTTLSPLPTTSIEGITGTWSPAMNNTATTTYTFTPSAGQCATTATMTITVNPNVTPTFTPVSAICSGTTLSPLPTTSIEGITGTWSPAMNNAATTTYTFTPTAGQCATTATMTITVNPNVTPTFTPVAAICSGATLSALPTTSVNGINGTWSPAMNNTATTTYTFTPSAGQCATTTTMTITVNPNVTPTFTPVAAICSGVTLSALPTTSVNGINGTWSPALNNTATTTYTFTPTAGQCATTTTMTITVNPNVTPSFTPVAAICSGATLSALPTTSANGINGTWSPALNNTATTTYTFTPTAGQCATTTTMTITVNPNVTPTFTPVAAICSGATLSALPTTSANGINGTWSPALNNTATTTYTFTPTAGQCATTTTMTITVNSTAAPTGAANQNLGNGQTIGNIAVNGANVVWYASAADAANGVNPIPASTMVNNTTYYATQTVAGCTSASSLAVTVTIVLGTEDFRSNEFKYYPNPVNDILTIESAQAISSVEVYNVAGQKVGRKSTSDTKTTFDTSGLPSGTYLVRVIAEDEVKILKVIKK